MGGVVSKARAGETGFSWRLAYAFDLAGATFAFRQRRKDKRGRLPAVKGNTPKVIKIGGGFSVSPGERTVAAGKALARELAKVRHDELFPLAPIEGPVRLEVDFVFEPAASWPKKRRSRALAGLEPCVEKNRGDLEQLLKLLNDELERAGYFADDSQVVEVAAAKLYGKRQGYRVRLWSRVLA